MNADSEGGAMMERGIFTAISHGSFLACSLFVAMGALFWALGDAEQVRSLLESAASALMVGVAANPTLKEKFQRWVSKR